MHNVCTPYVRLGLEGAENQLPLSKDVRTRVRCILKVSSACSKGGNDLWETTSEAKPL